MDIKETINGALDGIGDFFGNLWDELSSWFIPEKKAFLAAAAKVEEEIERIGPAIFYAAVNAGLSSLANDGKLTGNAIKQAADIAIETLVNQGKVQVTGAVFTAIGSALTELHAEASKAKP